MSILPNQVARPGADRTIAEQFSVGGWRVDAVAGKISSGDTQMQLEPKAAEVLVYLAQHPGRVVSRQELEASVWNGRVISYDAVTNAVIKLRKAFGDDARDPHIIETLSKRGYRLVAPVESAAIPADPQNPIPSGVAAPDPGQPTPRRRWAAGVLAGLSTILAILLWSEGDRRPFHDGAAPGAFDRVAIVVLPFDNLSGDRSQDYFSNGLTDDLITELSGFPGLAVIANNSAFAYRGDESLAQLREELGVRFVLRGSVRRDAERVRVNAQLIDAAGGRHLWAERYEAKAEDTFAVQDALVERIATSLNASVRGGKPNVLQERYSASIEAYDHFLQGKDQYGRRGQDDLKAAEASFEKAIKLDPHFARAYASLALVHLRDVMDAWTDDASASLRRAHLLARQATELDGALPEAHYVNAFVALFERRYRDAVAELDRAIMLRPSYADAHATLAWVLHFAGRPEQGKQHLETASLLNPHVIASYLLVDGGMAFTLGHMEHAVATLRQALEISPTHPRVHIWLAAAYARAGQRDEASWIVEQLLVMHPTISIPRIEDAFPFKDPASLERLVTSLRDAGLPE